jgi:hypothetical protein
LRYAEQHFYDFVFRFENKAIAKRRSSGLCPITATAPGDVALLEVSIKLGFRQGYAKGNTRTAKEFNEYLEEIYRILQAKNLESDLG